MCDGGQYFTNAWPMTHEVGIGPQKRLSSDSPRLSPIMKTWPVGTTIVRRKSHEPPGRQGLMNGSDCSLPLRITCPPRIAIESPATATTRLMKVCVEGRGVGVEHGLSVPAPWLVAPQIGGIGSAPCGGLTTRL